MAKYSEFGILVFLRAFSPLFKKLQRISFEFFNSKIKNWKEAYFIFAYLLIMYLVNIARRFHNETNN